MNSAQFNYRTSDVGNSMVIMLRLCESDKQNI